jgi:transcriptional regulator of arginine metabolism
MTDKRDRHRLIRSLIATESVGSQEELRLRLAAHGLNVTQATLSRDLRELGIARVPSEDGSRYRLPGSGGDEGKPLLAGLLPQLFSSVDGVGELLVLHTLPSGAQPVAEAIDAQAWPEILGTIAGENTVLIVCRSADARRELSRRLETMAGQ